MKLSIFHFVDKKKTFIIACHLSIQHNSIITLFLELLPQIHSIFHIEKKIHVADSDYKSTRALIRFIFQNMLLTLQRT